MTAEQIGCSSRRSTETGVTYRSELYEGAATATRCPTRPSTTRPRRSATSQELFALLERTLAAPAG